MPNARKIQLATLCYIFNEQRVLLLYRNKKPQDHHEGKYNGLGGKVEPGESFENCLLREVKEESGLVLQNYRWHGSIMFPLFTKDTDWLVYLYSSTAYNGQIEESPEGELEWVELDRLFDLPLWPGDKVFLPWVLDNKMFSADFYYRNGEFTGHQVSHWGAAKLIALTTKN